jgi:PAS domain S-box-containing protein
MQLHPVSCDEDFRLSAEQKLRLQAQLLNSVEQAILAVNLTGCIVFWNRYAETFYGWTMEEVQGRNIGEILASPLLMESALRNLESLRSGEDWSGKFLMQRRDGTTLMVSLSATLIQNEPHDLIGIVSVSCDGIEHQQLQEANRLLAEVRMLLTDVVDYEAPLMTLAQLAVPQLADWCAVHLLNADGSIEQMAIAPAKSVVKQVSHLQAAYDWLMNFLPNDDANGLPAVLRSGEPKLVTDVASSASEVAAAIKSYMIVPLIARPQIFGAITFVVAESGRHFDHNTLALAENLVSHIIIYFDKVRMYRESQRLNAELEQRVNERTVELRTAIVQLKQSEATIQTLFRISNNLNKESAPEELVQAIRKILHGGEYISASVADELVLYARHDDDLPLHKHLSDREYQVLCLIASGKEVKEISSELSLSAKTIST